MIRPLTKILKIPDNVSYILFLDESGTPHINLSKLIDSKDEYPIFVLCGVIIDLEHNNLLKEKFDTLKNKYWDSPESPIIFVSNKIRKQEGHFKILNNKDIRENFYDELDNIVSEINFTILATVIDKTKHSDKYVNPYDPYKLSLEFILERFVGFFLREQHKIGMVVAEERGRNENKKLREHFQKLYKSGTEYVTSKYFRDFLHNDLIFRRKIDNIPGLQLADLCAYPIGAEHLKHSKNFVYQIIEKKFYFYPNHIGKGLKIFP